MICDLNISISRHDITYSLMTSKHMTTVYGWIASAISSIYKIPQIYLLYCEKKHKGLSILSVGVQLTSYIFYTAHGFSIKDTPTICMGFVGLVQTSIIFVMYFKYKSLENTETIPNDGKHEKNTNEPTDL